MKLLYGKIQHNCRKPFSQTTKMLHKEGLMNRFRRWCSWSQSLDSFEAIWKVSVYESWYLTCCRCLLTLPPTHRPSNTSHKFCKFNLKSLTYTVLRLMCLPSTHWQFSKVYWMYVYALLTPLPSKAVSVVVNAIVL